MSQEKKRARTKWRDAVFKRAKGRCQAYDTIFRCCGPGVHPTVRCPVSAVDPHHITPRGELPGGGYDDVDNGIALCSDHHEAAESGKWDAAVLRVWAKQG